jgi:hypothetical protein
MGYGHGVSEVRERELHNYIHYQSHADQQRQGKSGLQQIALVRYKYTFIDKLYLIYCIVRVNSPS